MSIDGKRQCDMVHGNTHFSHSSYSSLVNTLYASQSDKSVNEQFWSTCFSCVKQTRWTHKRRKKKISEWGIPSSSSNEMCRTNKTTTKLSHTHYTYIDTIVLQWRLLMHVTCICFMRNLPIAVINIVDVDNIITGSVIDFERRNLPTKKYTRNNIWRALGYLPMDCCGNRGKNGICTYFMYVLLTIARGFSLSIYIDGIMQ